MTALFEINPDVYNTDQFRDIVILDNYSIALLYNKLYDQYIKTELTQNRFFYNNRFILHNEHYYYAYVFTLDNKDYKDVYTDIVMNGSLMLRTDFYIKVCITWKKYLDNSFYECLKCEACEQCKKEPRPQLVWVFIFNLLQFAFHNTFACLVYH